MEHTNGLASTDHFKYESEDESNATLVTTMSEMSTVRRQMSQAERNQQTNHVSQRLNLETSLKPPKVPRKQSQKCNLRHIDEDTFPSKLETVTQKTLGFKKKGASNSARKDESVVSDRNRHLCTLLQNSLLRVHVARALGESESASNAHLYRLLKKRGTVNHNPLRPAFSRSDSLQSLPQSVNNTALSAERACSVSDDLHVISKLPARSRRRSSEIPSFEDFKRRNRRPQTIDLTCASSSVALAETDEKTPTNVEAEQLSCGEASEDSVTLHEQIQCPSTPNTDPALTSTLPFEVKHSSDAEAGDKSTNAASCPLTAFHENEVLTEHTEVCSIDPFFLALLVSRI